jgi:hypothetical protein
VRQRVFLINENIYAELIQLGAFASRIQYTYGGTLYDVFVENDEFILEDNNLTDEMDYE